MMPRPQGPGTAVRREKQARRLRRAKRVLLLSFAFTLFFSVLFAVTAYASDFTVTVGSGEEAGNMGSLEVIATLAFLALLPSLFMMMTSFTRILIVLSFMRNAMGTQNSPPNMVLTSLALVLTLFIMMPVLNEMNTTALQPWAEGELTATEALDAASLPIKRFMLQNATPDSLEMFLSLSQAEAPQVADIANPVELLDLPLLVVAPAFITSEITRAFWMGFLIYMPFLVIDIVVSSILMSMGMMMLPPAMISLPFKILMFVIVDGWSLMIDVLVRSFRF
jgi:flagellar biosynthetic protein FliP